MKKHPISMMFDTIKDISTANNSPSIQIGQILAPPPAIQVQYNGIILEAEDCWISQYLLAGYTRQIEGALVSGTQSSQCSLGAPHTHPIDNSYTASLTTTDTLQAGDYVSIMPMPSSDGTVQQYVILDKIVHL